MIEKRKLNKLILILPLMILGLPLTVMQECSLLGDGEIIPDSITTVVQEPGDTPFQPADRDDTLSPPGTITVSGSVTGPSGAPVAGVKVILNWGGNVVELTTNASGFYSYTSPYIGQWLNIHVRPPVSMRLAYRNWGTGEVEDDLTKDFELQDGHLLSGAIYTPNGEPFIGGGWLGLTSLTVSVPESEWLGDGIDDDAGAFQIVLPPGIKFIYHKRFTAISAVINCIFIAI